MSEELQRGFGYWTILALAIGSVMGTTIFLGVPIAAKHSGNLLIVTWIILSVIALYIAACFGELTAMFPKAGGAYEFSKQAYGKFKSFNIAWIAWLFGSLSTALVIIAAVQSLDIGLSDYQNFLIGVALAILLNMVAYLGVNASSFMLLILGIIMLAIPVSIIAGGIPQVNLNNLQPLFTHSFFSIFVTLFFMAEAYFGWESATYLAEETKNPTKVIPKALLHSTAIIGVLGLVLFVVILGIIPSSELAKYEQQGSSEEYGDYSNYALPLNLLASKLYNPIGAELIGEGTITSLIFAGIFLVFIGTALATVLSMPRLLLALARDKMFLGQFSKLHPKFKTPHYAIMFQTVVLVFLLVIGSAEYEKLLQLLTPMAVILYVSMLVAVVVLRKKMPEKERPFKILLSPWGPIFVSVFFIAIIAGWLIFEPGAWNYLKTSVSLMLFGIPLYLLVELYYDPKMITHVNDTFAYATFFLQKITRSGNSIRKEIMAFFGADVKGKTVLEFGCGVGSLTLKLADRVGSLGKLYAVHFSKNNVKIARKRFEIKKWEKGEWAYENVKILHDPEQLSRIHPDITYADATVSVGMLGYIQDIRKILRELYSIMPTGGKLCIVENTDFFHVIPNIEWLSNDRNIENLFREAGFAVRVKRKKGLLWNTVFVYGIKYTGQAAYI